MKSTVKCIVSLLLIVCVQQLSAQSVPAPSPDSRTVLLKGVALYEKGEYKEAANVFGSIHRNDTSYLLSLYEKALALQQDSSFDDALQTINLALAEQHTGSIHDYLILKANIIDDMGKSEEALRLYDSVLKLFPVSQTARSQKVTTLVRLKRYDEAEALARECVVMNFLNPLYHYKLGVVAYSQGKIVPTLMAMLMAQVVNPSNNNVNRVVTYLSSICNAKDETLEAQQKRTGDYPDNFSRVEQIIFSKVAMDKGYKVKFNLDDNIFKQINVMLEKLEFDETSDDPYMQLYVPYFKQVFADKKVEVMLNHAFSGLSIDAIATYMKKNKSEVAAFGKEAFNYVELIRNTRTVNYNARQTAPRIYHFDENRFYAEGKMVGESAEGYWKFYFSDGYLKAEGELAGNERNGTWKFYHENGRLESEEVFNKGVSDGPVKVYYPSGVLKRTITYKDGKAEGTVKNYSLYGVLLSEEQYVNNEQHGKETNYYNDGTLKSEFNYKNGKADGPYIIYYGNKTVKEQGGYKEGELDGEIKEFFTDGKVKAIYQYSKGKGAGTWSYFHRNGKPDYKLVMTENGAQGEVLHYNDAGVLTSKETYKDGINVGITEYYHKGKPYVYYKSSAKGKTNEIRYVDSLGNEKLINKRSGKIWSVTYYSPYGFKVSEKQFNQDEELTNEAVYYDPQGVPVLKEMYKNGELEGKTQSWYSNKALKSETEYIADKKTGTSVIYFPNGKLSTVSFYNEDVMQDYLYDYSVKGILQSKYFYAQGEKTGYGITNYANGTPFYEEKYLNGWITEVTQFDTTGKRMKTIRFENGKGTYKLVYPNGKIYYELPLLNGVWEGVQKTYFPDGKLMGEMHYKNDQKHGPAKYYYANGKVSLEGAYLYDEKNGTWKSYNEEGQLEYEEYYVDGLQEGKAKYYDAGKLERELEFKDGDRHGTARYYSKAGELAFELYYDDGMITSYAYLDRTKKLVKPIQLVNFTGTVEAYYSNGTKSAHIEVAAGLYNGKYNLFNEKGVLTYESTEEYGSTNGVVKTYYDNGKLRTEFSQLFDLFDGPYKEYYPDGKLKEEVRYESGNVHGPYKVYDPTGKLVETRFYHYGYLQDIKK
jgi:antitoxin component YwqK of YwqJK toxin-antitoxin module